jgi:drug/metabolite transporter (DMT)-like permease
MAGTLTTLLAVLLWSFHATVGDLAVHGISALQLTAEAYAVSLGLLLAIVCLSRISIVKCLKELAPWLCILLLASGPIMMIYYLALYKGLSMAPAVDVYIIHYLWPIFAAVFTKLCLRRDWGTRGTLSWFLMLAAFCGAGLVVLGGGGQAQDATYLAGYLLAGVSAVCGGLYLPSLVLAGDRLVGKGYAESAGFLIPYLMLLAGGLAALTLYLPFSGASLTSGSSSWAGALFIGIGVFVLAEMAWVFGVRWQRSQATTSLAYLTPVFSTLLLLAIAGEHLHASTAYGIALIVGANMFLQMSPQKMSRSTGVLV